MKKLLQINTVLNGSTGKIARQIGKTAAKNGWRSNIAYGKGRRDINIVEFENNFFGFGNKLNYISHAVQSRILDNHGLGSKLATRSLCDFILKIKPDIVQIHNLHGYYVNFKLLFKTLKKINVPVVWTFHDCWPITGHCVYFDYVGCDKYKTKCHSCPQIRSYPESYFIDRSSKNFDIKKQIFSNYENLTIVVVSNWLNKIINQSFLSNKEIITIHNGIDLSIFKPKTDITKIRSKYDIQQKYILLGVANNWWEPRKGLKDFFLLHKIIDSNYKIVLVGLTEKEKKDLPDGILGICKTESIEQLAEIYTMSDIFVNPTYEDNYPTTNLEALACGTPVVTYDTGGSAESFDSFTGIAVKKGDINELKQSIHKILENKSNFHTKNCRKFAEDFHDQSNVFPKYVNLYNKILNKK